MRLTACHLLRRLYCASAPSGAAAWLCAPPPCRYWRCYVSRAAAPCYDRKGDLQAFHHHTDGSRRRYRCGSRRLRPVAQHRLYGESRRSARTRTIGLLRAKDTNRPHRKNGIEQVILSNCFPMLRILATSVQLGHAKLSLVQNKINQDPHKVA
eukprot:365126-Chlamydomonas_euryale.AAC.55